MDHPSSDVLSLAVAALGAATGTLPFIFALSKERRRKSGIHSPSAISRFFGSENVSFWASAFSWSSLIIFFISFVTGLVVWSTLFLDNRVIYWASLFLTAAATASFLGALPKPLKTIGHLGIFAKPGRLRVFVNEVSKSVVRRRVLQIAILFGISAVLFVLNDVAWPVLAVAGLTICDLALILYRRYRSLYGSNALEFGEAVRYVLSYEDKGGPGHFDRVFPETAIVHDRSVPDGITVRPV